MKHALIVDDKPENVYFLRALLHGYGFTVDEAPNGAIALEKARAELPSLVVSDLLMPVMDGYTLLRHWKADETLRTVPFIVYTATYTEPRDEQLALDLGADAFIVKPSEPEPFMARVQEVLERSARTNEPPRSPVTDDDTALKVYSEVLVNKLEQKASQLEERIAELTQAEERIRRLNSFYAALSETNQAIVHLTEREELFRTICRIAVERSGFALAWVGMIDEAGEEIIPLAWCGEGPAWFARLQPFRAKGEAHTPIEMAIAVQGPRLFNDAQTAPALSSLHAHLRDCDLRSAAAFPLRIGERIVGGLELYSQEPGYFDETLGELLAEMVTDVSFALQNYEKEAERKENEARLRASEEANRLSNRALEASANGIVITDSLQPGHPIIYVNPAFERITGYSADEAIGRDTRFLLGGDAEQLGVEEIRAALREQREGEAILKSYHKNGNLFWNELSIAPVKDVDGRTTHFVGVINDITERKLYEQELERHANRDLLTGLANRNLLKDRITQAIAFATRMRSMMAVLLIDLDHFKRINDSLGHEFGDTILRETATRMAACVGEQPTLARIGGDEFVIVLPDVGRPQDVALMASNVLQSLSEPMTVGGRVLSLTASIGVSLYPQDGTDHDLLLRNADAAMYRAKEGGRNTWRFYTADMNAHALAQLELAERLRHALERAELLLHYQPLLSLADGTITDVEALLRWRGADGKLIAPAEFIPLAEDTGLIIPIGEWVLRQACAQLVQWQRDGGHHLRVAVNLSARQFRDPNLVQCVRSALEQSGLSPSLLKLEVTESSVMDNAVRAADILSELRALGVSISVDDFGTGYSSLAYLRRFPIDQLKIDRSFVQEVTEHAESAAIVHGIISLARSLRLQTVAEGVETVEQREFLREAGCDKMQGFLFSRPLPPDDLHALLLTHRVQAEA